MSTYTNSTARKTRSRTSNQTPAESLNPRMLVISAYYTFKLSQHTFFCERRI